jgi:hypothetical protein
MINSPDAMEMNTYKRGTPTMLATGRDQIFKSSLISTRAYTGKMPCRKAPANNSVSFAEATRMAAEVADFSHTIIYDNEGFNRYFAGVFGGNG